MPDDHTQQWTTSMPTDSPITWYTPPQMPPCDDPEICAMEPSLELPPDSLYVLGTIVNQMTPMLVDTGASVTAVSYSFFSTLLPSPTMQTTLLTSIRTVSGEELPILGQATLSFTFDATPYSFSVMVFDNLTYPVVLGCDFLTHFGSIIDMQAHSLVLSGNLPLPLHNTSRVPDNASSITTPVTVHAYTLSESVIPVFPKTALEVGSTGLIEPSSKLAERYHVCGASQMVAGFSEDHTFPFRVLNPKKTNQLLFIAALLWAPILHLLHLCLLLLLQRNPTLQLLFLIQPKQFQLTFQILILLTHSRLNLNQ